MECPRCGFRQPEDLYCARCGVSIRKALRRRYVRWTMGLLAAASLFIWGTLTFVAWLDRTSKPPSQLHLSSNRPKAPTEQGPKQPLAERPSPRPKKKATKSVSSPSLHPQETPSRDLQAKPSPSIPPASTEPMAKPKTPRPSEPDPEEQLRRWAALEWFDQGQALSDNSEEELGFYRRALEVFPGFAPAAYFMGVIYLEWGDRETALRAFRRFLRYATPEELQRYPLPETITPEELENVPSPPQ